jgi:hypothetical protein
MLERATANIPLFARCMGVARGTLRQYLKGLRPTPSVAVSAANFALISLGHSITVPRARIAQNLWPSDGRKGKSRRPAYQGGRRRRDVRYRA